MDAASTIAAMPTPRSYQDIVDAHLLFRERCGEVDVLPPVDFFFKGLRIGQEVRVRCIPRSGDQIAYADSYRLYTFEVP